MPYLHLSKLQAGALGSYHLHEREEFIGFQTVIRLGGCQRRFEVHGSPRFFFSCWYTVKWLTPKMRPVARKELRSK
jgi:hypothetical protein